MSCFLLMVSLCWFRSDLRTTDNTALWHARQAGPVVGVYYATPGQWRDHDMAGCRATFILQNLRTLRSDLAGLGIPLLYRQVESFDQVAAQLADLVRQLGAKHLFCNREYALNEQCRDATVAGELQVRGINYRSFDDYYLLAPGSVTREDGGSYQVYTPFSRAWKAEVAAGPVETFSVPERQSKPDCPAPGEIPHILEGFDFDSTVDMSLWPAGEREAASRLQEFVDHYLPDYQSGRDFPAASCTSRLSPYLAVGAISPRQCLKAALRANSGELSTGQEGVRAWINELIWRDFYGHILSANPRLSMGWAFRREYEQIPWRDNPEHYDAWCAGRTGVPFVDAGMRELLATGWMHNRLRMVTAMFLSKNLLMDWRLGECHFMRHLLDGDLAQNNGGWQWSASTGTDAAPYFRIFNPFTQAQRFDPQGDYVRRWVPELAKLPGTAFHHPDRLAAVRPSAYPEPLIDLAESRGRAIEFFRRLRPAK